MKKTFLVLVLAVVAAGFVSAQAAAAVQVPYFELSAKPTSTIKGASYRFGQDIDNFLDVVDYQKVAFDNLLLSFGGNGGTVPIGATPSLNFGLAKKFGENYLALYLNGRMFNGDGGTYDKEDDTTGYTEQSRVTWNDNIGILFASPGLGGIRFDLLFPTTEFRSDEEDDGDTLKSNGAFVTSLKWGKKFGSFTPRATVGVRWGNSSEAYNKATDQTTTSTGLYAGLNPTSLGVKLEADIKDFKVDYQLSVAFESTQEIAVKDTTSGPIDNLLNLYYNFTVPASETITVKARPQLQFGLTTAENEETSLSTGTLTTGASSTMFSFTPLVELGFEYKLSPKIGLYTGTRVILLNVTSTETKLGTVNGVNDYTAATGTVWAVRGLNLAGTTVAFALKPSPNLTIEAGLNNTINIGNGGWALNLNNLGGSLSVIIKPAAKAEAAAVAE